MLSDKFKELNKLADMMTPSRSEDVDDLDPELRKGFVTPDDPRVASGEKIPGIYTKFIHQPFVLNITYINEAHRLRKQAAEECLANGDLEQYLYRVEKPYRMQELLAHFDLLPRDANGVDLIISTWCNVENLYEYGELLTLLLDVLKNRFPENERFDKDVPLIEDEDGLITLYRGYNAQHNAQGEGYSYTTSKKRAVWFSQRYALNNTLSFVREIKVRRSDIAFTTNRRNEFEVVPLCEEVIGYE